MAGPGSHFGVDSAPLAIGDWLLCTALASIVLWADEGKKLVERWLRR